MIDTFDNFPETSTDVLLRDKNLKTLRILKTDANGKVQFKNSINIYEIEIASNTGYNRNAILRYKFLRGKNALVRLKLIEYGGEPVDGGPHGWSYYFEPIIEYEMIKKNNKIIAVKLNDFSYNRVK